MAQIPTSWITKPSVRFFVGDRLGHDRRSETCRRAGVNRLGFLRVAIASGDRAVVLMTAFAWSGLSAPHARQGCSASSATPVVGEPTETKKARYVVALRRVLRLPFRESALGLFVRLQARANLGSGDVVRCALEIKTKLSFLPDIDAAACFADRISKE
ncbi:MAG: hypothetical protein ACTSP2_04750 [Alphaproteobacteria bacterium]